MLCPLEWLLGMFLIINSLNKYSCLQVNIKENHNIQVEPFKTRMNKRDISQFFDKASYSFNGFEKIESVPIIFPLDICIFMVNQVRHYACLHVNRDSVRKFVIFRTEHNTYEEVLSLETPLAIGMDCKSFGQKGFVALAYNITSTIEQADQGSPIFQVDSQRIKAVQYFGSQNLRAVYLRGTANDLFLLQTFDTSSNVNDSAADLFCPYFKWSGYGFNTLGKIPCSNAQRVEPFAIDSENFFAVANYADEYGRTETNSEIYKYDREKRQLVLLQKIKTFAAVDVKYFSVPFEEVKKMHFLIFGNTHSKGGNRADHLEADSVIYKYENGTFIPYQMLPLYSVQKFLPVENVELEKFILLVACSNQVIKIYNLNDWKFEESKAQFTEGALGKGVSNMRIYNDNAYSYLVISNERMLENETNVFLPIYKQEEHANSLRQQIIDWTMATIDRLGRIDVEKLRNDVVAAAKLKKDRKVPQVAEVPSATIEIAYTRSVTNSKRKLSASYWKALSYAHQAVEALEARANKKLSTKRHTSDEEKPEYVHETLNVGTLVVRNRLKAKQINGVDPKDVQLKTMSAPKVIVNGDFQRPPETKSRSDVIPEFLDTLSVGHLKTTGKLNDFSWNELQSNTLKRTGQQFLRAAVNISTLKTDRLVSSSGIINDQNILKLVPIDGGRYVINQDIQFAKPIYAQKLTINDRLNNIHVLQNKLDVLLIDSDEVQHITGRKTFDNVRLLEPVTISGKIFGELDIMSPFKPNHRSINLTGHYTITGDVGIKEILAASNIIGASGNHSFKKVLERGLPVSAPIEGLKLHFEQPIEANSSIATFVNGFDLQQLVRTDSDEVQIIEGHKTFIGDLLISTGFAQAKLVNNIDVDQLEKSVLMKTGQQNITGNLRFKQLIAKSIASPSIRLQGNDLSNYITKTGDQVSEGSLKTERLRTQFATFGNLATERKVFDNKLATIKHPDVTSQSPDILQNFEGIIDVQNLKVAGYINENSVEEIEKLLTQLNGNVKYVGAVKIHSDMKVSNLSFTNTFNGITVENFANCWLQQGREQVFTAPQIFSSVSIPKGLTLTGKLNEHNFTDFTVGAYRTDADEHISDAVFENSIKVETAILATTVNGLQIPEDILILNSPEAQELRDNLICAKNVHVQGHIQNLATVNNMNLDQINDYLDGEFTTITVQHAIFEIPPSFVTLNSYDLKKTMDTIWFANADVDLQHHVEIADGFFEGRLEFYGPINGMNLKYLEENYFSLSKPQEVSAEILFSKQVVFENDFDVQSLQLYGPMIEGTSNSEINFNDLTQNSLLNLDKQQRITGQWKIFEGIITGDLSNIRINNLNLADDVLRLDSPHNKITAQKHIPSATIRRLYCEPRSAVNGINPTDWIHSAVFVYENYTIQGKVTLDSVIFYNDVQVLGTVNNVSFDENTLLLRDTEQVIQGSIQIVTKLPEEQRILSSTFEKMNAVSVNGLNVEEFFRNQCVGTKHSPIKGSVTFISPVYTEHFDSAMEFIPSKGNRANFDRMHNRTVEMFAELKEIVQHIGHSYRGDVYYLSHFEHKQTMHVSGKKVISLTLQIGENFLDIIGVLKEHDDSNVIFYRWDFYQQQFVLDKHLSCLPKRKTLIDIFTVAFGKAEYLAIESSLDAEFYQNVISTETEGLDEIFKSNSSSMIEALELDGEHCFVVNKEHKAVISVYCVDIKDNRLRFVEKNDLRRDGVMQIVSLEKDYIAALLADCVEIWKPNEPEKPIQRISTVNPSQIAAVVGTNSTKFLAICSKITPKSFHHGSVDIYRSSEDTSFQHIQTIDIVSPLQVEFALLPESHDILLNILTESFDEPLAIYLYKGIVGFQPIVGSSTVPPGAALSIINLRASQQHLLAVISEDDITLIEAVLSKT